MIKKISPNFDLKARNFNTSSNQIGINNFGIKKNLSSPISDIVSFKGKSELEEREKSLEENLTPKGEEIYRSMISLARDNSDMKIRQIHALRVISENLIHVINKMDEGDLDADDYVRFTSIETITKRFGDDVFKKEKQRALLKKALNEQIIILDEKLSSLSDDDYTDSKEKKGFLKRFLPSFSKPRLARDFLNDIGEVKPRSDSDDDFEADNTTTCVAEDHLFFDAALWPMSEKVDKEISKPYILALSKALMTHNSENGKIPMKFFEDKAKTIWENLELGTNMFVLYEPDMNKDFIFDTFEDLLQQGKTGSKKFNAENTVIHRFGDNANADFVLEEMKKSIKDKDKNHVFIYDYHKVWNNDSSHSASNIENYFKELHKYPNMRFVLTSEKDKYYNSVIKKDETYGDFSQISIPIINKQQAKEMFRTEKALMKKIKKEFEPDAVDKIVDKTEKLSGQYPEKVQKILRVISSYYGSKNGKITLEDVDNYIKQAKEMFKVNDEDKSSVHTILDTELTLDDIVGLKSTKKEAQSIVNRIKDGSIGTKGYIIYSQDKEVGSGRNHVAKAIAGEAKIPFLEINAVDFGTKDVSIFEDSSISPESAMKKLFSMAKAQAETNPNNALILYIQNFEYFSYGEYVSEYHEKAMSQLLREMKAAKKQGLNIVVMGSVNNPDAIGESTRKSFMFVDKLEIESPSRNKEARKELMRYYFGDKELQLDAKDDKQKEEILDYFAELTEYFSLNKIMNTVEKVGTVAKERGHNKIDKGDFIEAYMQIQCGRPNVNNAPAFSKEITTSHECGHAITSTIMHEITKSLKPWFESDHVGFITLDPRSYYLAAVYPTKTNESQEFTFEKIFSDIVCDFGGYSSEKHFYGIDGSWGITGDMQNATMRATEATGVMGIGHYFGKKSLDGVAFIDGKDKKNMNKDIEVFLKNAQLISNMIVEEYEDFIKQFTQKYASKVGTGECIITGDTFRKELEEWRNSLPEDKKEDLKNLNEVIIDVMQKTQNGEIIQ